MARRSMGSMTSMRRGLRRIIDLDSGLDERRERERERRREGEREREGGREGEGGVLTTQEREADYTGTCKSLFSDCAGICL